MRTDCLSDIERENFIVAKEHMSTAINLLAEASDSLFENGSVAGLNISQEFRETIRRLDADIKHLDMMVDIWSHTV